MGIWGLQSSVDENHWYDEVNIKDIADEWRRTNPGELVIAVDGPGCARRLYGKGDKICGGQYKQFREACRTFVKECRDSGIRLFFFFDGLPVEEKVDRWVERRKGKLKKISKLFALFRAKPLSKIDKKDKKDLLTPEAVVPGARVILRTELGCEVRVATADCDRELAEFAAGSDHCLGVISDDTDFLAHDGVPCVITLLDETDDRLKVRRYNPADIASKLGLRREDLPVFATFAGNDIIIKRQLKSLHKRLKSRYGKDNIENVARFVREGPPENVKDLCAYAFKLQPNHLEDEVRASIDSYRHGIAATDDPIGDDAWGEVLWLAEQRHVTCKMPAVVYAVMKRRRFRIGEVMEDLARKRKDSPPTGLVLRPMRARLYGLLLSERGPEPVEVMELVPTEINNIPLESVTPTRLPPDIPHPGLRALWQEDAAVEDQRWRLFAWVTSPRVKVSALRALSPPHLVVPAVALSYLRHGCHPPLLREEEAAVFAAVAVAVGDASASFLAGPVLESVDERAVYLATLFVRTVLHVLDAAAACGLSFPCAKDCLPDAYFDGRYFHDVYVAAISQSSRKRKKYLDDPSYYLNWCASYEQQFQQLMGAVECVD